MTESITDGIESANGDAEAAENVRQRLYSLELQLLQLREELEGERAQLPSESFSALEVRVGVTWHLLPIESILEVVAVPWCQPLPDAPSWVVGTFRYGPEPVPLIDLRARLDNNPSHRDPSALVVIVKAQSLVGFLIEAIRDVHTIDPEVVIPLAPGIKHAPYLIGSVPTAGETSLHLLAVDRLSREFILGAQ